MIRRKQVVGDRDKPGHDTFVTQGTFVTQVTLRARIQTIRLFLGVA